MAMSQNKDLKSICRDLADKIADENGFVSIVDLLERFRAELVVRPLLVEAAIGKDPESQGDWLVLVDEETYGKPSGPERYLSPWNPRMRFSIAHELAHTITFHPKEFGFKFSLAKRKGESEQEFLLRVERQTDSATPFLLLAKRAISRFPGEINTKALREYCKGYGISSNVLLSFLLHLDPTEDQDLLEKFQNVAIGLINNGRFLPNPLFSRFEQNLIPNLIRDIRSNKSFMIGDLGEPDSNGELGIVTGLGTYQFPGNEEIDFVLTVEPGEGNRFFILQPGKASQPSFNFTRDSSND